MGKSGAYIAASFAHAYPQYVHKLILLSPVGLDSERELIGIPILDGSHTAIPDSSGKTSLIERVIEYVWKKYHRTPIALIRLGGPLLPWAIRSFVSSSNLFDWIADDKKLRKLVWHYTYGLIRRPSSAEVLMPYFISE